MIGVVRDYHQQSLQNKFTPVILFMDPALRWVPTKYYVVRIRPGYEHAVTAAAGKLWEGYFAESSFDFFFLDDFYNAQYRQDIEFGRIFLLFSSLAVVIACKGQAAPPFGLEPWLASRPSSPKTMCLSLMSASISGKPSGQSSLSVERCRGLIQSRSAISQRLSKTHRPSPPR